MAKFELVYKVDYDGRWFHILKDGIFIKTIGVHQYPFEEVRTKAEAEFDKLVNDHSFVPTSEIIKTVVV